MRKSVKLQGDRLDAFTAMLEAKMQGYFNATTSSHAELREKIGTSTPLIVWNIAVLIAIGWLTAKLYGVAPY